MSLSDPHFDGLVPSLRCYLEMTEILEGGAQWKEFRSLGSPIEGDLGILSPSCPIPTPSCLILAPSCLILASSFLILLLPVSLFAS